MSLSIRTARSLMIAVLTLALAAGVAAAARPDQDHGLVRAGEAAGKVVPVPAEEPAADEPTEPTEDGEGAVEVVDEIVGEANEHPENHGKYVSEAARGETPDGWDNHGAYVRSIAQGDDGKPNVEVSGEDAVAAAGDSAPKKAKPAHARGHGANR